MRYRLPKRFLRKLRHIVRRFDIRSNQQETMTDVEIHPKRQRRPVQGDSVYSVSSHIEAELHLEILQNSTDLDSPSPISSRTQPETAESIATDVASTFESRDTFEPIMESEKNLMCLICKSISHKASQCRKRRRATDELNWFYSKDRDQLHLLRPSPEQPLCSRCKDLDLVTWLNQELPIQRDTELDRYGEYLNEEPLLGRQLGVVGDLELRQDCPLCFCLFGIIPTPSSTLQKVDLVRTWTMYRMEASMSIHTEEKRNSTKCITAMLRDSNTRLQTSELTSTRGDALCISNSDQQGLESSLHGQCIDPNRIPFEMIQKWIKLCEEKHQQTCTPEILEGLKAIRLVDVFSRRIVMYSADTKDYVALSYVWGGAKQDFPGSGKFGTKLGTLPKTIEDAIEVVKGLNMRYLWIDSVCINQRDKVDKHQQIGIMSAIYQGAYATIIAFSGTSTESGLPRVNGTPRDYQQLECIVSGTKIVSVGPTLSQLAWVMLWATRAWTYQEAALSPRCIYISKYQVIFECNCMTCYESIDVSTSHVHNTIHNEEFFKRENFLQQTNTGILRSPVAANVAVENNALRLYSMCATLYNYRSLTMPSDAEYAFDGIMQALSRKAYKTGFFHALPVEDFNWALCWKGRYRSGCTTEGREKFPSWSWLSWGDAIWPGQPRADGPQEPRRYTVDLHIARKHAERLQTFFSTCYHDMSVANKRTLRNDPLANLPASTSSELPAQAASMTGNAILIDATLLKFSLSDWEEYECDSGEHFFLVKQCKGIEVQLFVIDTSDLLDLDFRNEKHKFVLLAQHVSYSWVQHFLLLLQSRGDGTFGRNCVVRLDFPAVQLSVLRHFRLRRGKVVLV